MVGNGKRKAKMMVNSGEWAEMVGYSWKWVGMAE